ncbi:MAG: hypothetical protein WAW62_03820 [Candidatus Saccharimonas aalborgensis]
MPSVLAERPGDDEQRFNGIMRWQLANDPFLLPRLEAAGREEIAFADIARHESVEVLVDGYDAVLEQYTLDVTREVLTVHSLFEALLAAGQQGGPRQLSLSDREAIKQILTIEFADMLHLCVGDQVKITGDGVSICSLPPGPSDVIDTVLPLSSGKMIVGTIKGPVLIELGEARLTCGFLVGKSRIYDTALEPPSRGELDEVVFILNKTDSVCIEKLLLTDT